MNFSRPIRTSTAQDTGEHRIVWAVYPADRTTPVAAFERLRATGHKAALLESVEGPERLARYSFVAVDPDGTLRAASASAVLTGPDGESEILDLPPHEALREASARRRRDQPAAAHPDLPPFQGGWLGLFSYEWAATLEPRVTRPTRREFDLPEALFDHYPDVVAFDHSSQTLTVLCAAPGGGSDQLAAEARRERIAEHIGTADALAESSELGFRLIDKEPKGLTSRAEFVAGAKRLKTAISEGEIFQAVLSQRFEQRFEGDPFTLYRVLRLVNPAPHMFYFEADGLTLVGSSPERLVSVQNGHIEVVPIAGTRPRGATPAEDDRLGAELCADVKECAEHDMLVDLARNDAGRVARIGSVEVEQYRELVQFPRVQHLVSRVGAELAPGLDSLDALAAAFPAGTVSGAPKVRAMTLVAEIEGRERGAYAGAFGYLDRAGQLDVAIAIRTIVCHGGKLHVQAGAGIVFDSDPEKEFEETLHKASALFEAARMATSPAFQPDSTLRAEAPIR
ncbi:MAG: anthranilate synthase component 1 [Planctomycetota bacterium]|jgi:anthranilate synthase component 1